MNPRVFKVSVSERRGHAKSREIRLSVGFGLASAKLISEKATSRRLHREHLRECGCNTELS